MAAVARVDERDGFEIALDSEERISTTLVTKPTTEIETASSALRGSRFGSGAGARVGRSYRALASRSFSRSSNSSSERS
jgi:hypothetical protein